MVGAADGQLYFFERVTDSAGVLVQRFNFSNPFFALSFGVYAATVAGFAHPAGVEDRTLYMTVLTVLGAFLSFASIFLNKESWSVWKPNFRRLTPSTRPCLRDCVCVMAWWFTKIT